MLSGWPVSWRGRLAGDSSVASFGMPSGVIVAIGFIGAIGARVEVETGGMRTETGVGAACAVPRGAMACAADKLLVLYLSNK